MRANRWQRLWLAYVILALCLALTVTAYAYVKTNMSLLAEQRFDTATRTLCETIEGQLQRYIDTLNSTRGFLEASNDVTRKEWRTYTQSIDLRENYPGIQGIGLAVRVDPANLAEHEQAVQKEGFANYRVTPAGPRDIYFPILLLEPFDHRNQRAFGYDMFAEPVRQAAMRRAAESNAPAATSAVTLVQETEDDRQWGFLVYLPTYRRGMPVDTPTQRFAALRGFVFSPYRMGDLVRGALGERLEPLPLHFHIFDHDDPSKGTLVFDSDVHGKTWEHAVPPMTRRHRVAIADRNWTIQTWPTPNLLANSEQNLPWLVLTVGMLMSWLIFGLSWLQIRGRMASDLAAEKIARSERAARDSELRYRRKIEQSPLAVLTASPSGEPLMVNRSFEELWGIGINDLRGSNMFDHPLVVQLGLRQQLQSVVRGQTVQIGPLFIAGGTVPSGATYRERWVRSVVHPILDEQNVVKEIVVISEDFTGRKAVEEALRQAKEQAEAANRAKDQFLAVLSHELRNPLAPVLAMVSLLKEHALTEEQQHDAIETIRRNVELEARLIDDLLDITRITRGKLTLDFQPADAHELLRHAIEICTPDISGKNIRLATHLEAAAHHLRADPARLQQVFWNIIKNAVKFTPDGGRITVRTRDDAQNNLVISVEDNGIGIAPDKLSRIFDAFEQADRSITQRFGGLGLGLAISKALTEAHHGTISAASSGLGHGTTFTLTFPTIAARTMPQPHAPNGATVPARPRAGLRVLLVEDQADARRAMALLLDKLGYEVRAAEDAATALALTREWSYDVLLSDVGLPDESGIELVRKIHAIRDVPSIALTGLGMESDIQAALAAGFDEHLTKPVQLSKLESTIAALAARRK